MAELSVLRGVGGVEVNGEAGGRKAKRPGAPRPRKGKVVTAARVSWARRCITVAMGCGVPCLSLALSSIGGRLVSEGGRPCQVLGGAALVLCCSVLAVSLSHLAWAVRDITRSSWWQSWALAVAIDVSLVLGELAGVAGFRCLLVPVVMCAVVVVSAVLNCWAFLRHCQ